MPQRLGFAQLCLCAETTRCDAARYPASARPFLRAIWVDESSDYRLCSARASRGAPALIKLLYVRHICSLFTHVDFPSGSTSATLSFRHASG